MVECMESKGEKNIRILRSSTRLLGNKTSTRTFVLEENYYFASIGFHLYKQWRWSPMVSAIDLLATKILFFYTWKWKFIFEWFESVFGKIWKFPTVKKKKKKTKSIKIKQLYGECFCEQKKIIWNFFFIHFLFKYQCFTYHSTFPLLEFQFSIKTGWTIFP